jgi:hypothetical protein
MRKGVSKVFWVPGTSLSLTTPTAAAVIAGTELTGQVKEVAGFTFSNNPIDVPDLSSAFVNKIGGEDATEDSSLTFYEDDTSNPMYTALAKGTKGYVVWFPVGTAGATPAAGDDVDIWTSQVTSRARMYTADNEAATYEVKFALLAPPATDIALT